MARGHLRIYLGAAPGVGKTYAMLAEGQRRQARGTDVVIGVVETHQRRLTMAMVEGLEVVPRRSMSYQGMTVTELDVDALLARHPDVALVDEMAHRNPPGSRNAQRWQDIEELLDAGIDVITTLNIQHLESLSDVVEQITGVRQTETIADEVVRRADQVELVDMTAEALRRRMAHGNVYPPDRIQTALTHYFRPGNLTALRELALLWVADRVEEGQQRYRVDHGVMKAWETRERIVVGLSGRRGDADLLRRAARIAARIPGSDLLAVHVISSEEFTGSGVEVRARSGSLVESVGGSYHQIVSDDVARALVRFATAENATQIVLGVSHRPWPMWYRCDVGAKVTLLADSVDVHLVVHHCGRERPDGTTPRAVRHRRGATRGLATAATVLTVVTTILIAAYPKVGLAGDLLALLVFLVVAATMAWAMATAARQTRTAARANAVAGALTMLASSVLSGRADLPALLEQIRTLFALSSMSLLERDENATIEPRWFVAASAGDTPAERPVDSDVHLPVGDMFVLAGRGRVLSVADRDVLRACAAQLASIIQRGQVSPHPRADPVTGTARVHVALGVAISDALAPLLTTARSSLATNDDPDASLRIAQGAIARACELVSELSDIHRLAAGTLDVRLQATDLRTVLASALRVPSSPHSDLTVDIQPELPGIVADPVVLGRALRVLVADMTRRGEPGTATVTASTVQDLVELRFISHGKSTSEVCGLKESVLGIGLAQAAGAISRQVPTHPGECLVVLAFSPVQSGTRR